MPSEQTVEVKIDALPKSYALRVVVEVSKSLRFRLWFAGFLVRLASWVLDAPLSLSIEKIGVVMDPAANYVGWIAGMPWDRDFLTRLGVRGQMRLRPEAAYGFVFTHCEATGEVLNKLRETRFAQYVATFSLADDPCACSCSG